MGHFEPEKTAGGCNVEPKEEFYDTLKKMLNFAIFYIQPHLLAGGSPNMKYFCVSVLSNDVHIEKKKNNNNRSYSVITIESKSKSEDLPLLSIKQNRDFKKWNTIQMNITFH